MRKAMMVVTGGALALAALGCGASYDVHTMSAPDARFTELHTFRVLPTPRPRDGAARAGAYDPMVSNSIANRALRDAIVGELTSRGYTLDERAPDFLVAVYASAHERLDVTEWDYGYPYWPRRRAPGMPVERVTQYTEGTVVVDVITPQTRDLLWRGTASSRLTEDPVEDTKELGKVARAVIRKFPRATERVVAERR